MSIVPADAVLRVGAFEAATAPDELTELPSTFVPVIIDLGEGWWIDGERHGSFVGGLTDRPVAVKGAGAMRCLQVDLTPAGARRILGVPLCEIAHRVVPLEDLLGPDAPRLAERLDGAPGWGERLRLVETAVGRRLAAAPPRGAEVAWALSRIAGTRGGVRMDELRRELGWSPRRMIARFRDEVGMPPKMVARIVRFEALREHLRGEADGGLARVAAACGYHDQAHMAREVRELAGMTPSELVRRGGNSVQEPALATA